MRPSGGDCVPLTSTERTKLEIELALARSRLQTLNKLILKVAMGKLRRELRYDMRRQEKLIAEIEEKLAKQ